MTRQLVADCSRCAALCCVALPFTRSADFAFDKPAGVACRNLRATSCTVHDGLRERGFAGCAAYDCFGAGQHVTTHTFRGSERDAAMLAAFRVAQPLHELLFHLDGIRDVDDAAANLYRRIAELVDGPADQLAAADVDGWRAAAGAVLQEVSVRLRGPHAPARRHADLAGRDLRRTELRDADLRGAVLIAADLRGVDLARADLLGADLRDARLAGARLADTLFLTRPQLASAHVDGTTSLPPRLR